MAQQVIGGNNGSARLRPKQPTPLRDPRTVDPSRILMGVLIYFPYDVNQLRVQQTSGYEEPYSPSILESGSRADQVLKVAVAEMYLQGVSTRRGTKTMERLCCLEVSSTQVSKLTAELDTTFKQ